MKKLLTILFILPLIFSSCEKEDDTPNSNSNTNNNPTVNTTTGYISTQYGQIFKTTDSGVTWTYLDGLYSGSNGNFNMMSFP